MHRHLFFCIVHTKDTSIIIKIKSNTLNGNRRGRNFIKINTRQNNTHCKI